GLHEPRIQRALPRLVEDALQVRALAREALEQGVLQRTGGDRLTDRGRTLAARLDDVVAEPAHAERPHPLLEVLEVLRQAPVSARPQQVGAGRDGREAERGAVREVPV